jgi:hypothetical protein
LRFWARRYRASDYYLRPADPPVERG